MRVICRPMLLAYFWPQDSQSVPLLPHRGFPNPSSHSLAALPAPGVFNCDPWTTHVKVSLTHLCYSCAQKCSLIMGLRNELQTLKFLGWRCEGGGDLRCCSTVPGGPCPQCPGACFESSGQTQGVNKSQCLLSSNTFLLVLFWMPVGWMMGSKLWLFSGF